MEIVFKIQNGLCPSLLNDLIISKDVSLNLCGKNNLCMPDYSTVSYGKKSFK